MQCTLLQSSNQHSSVCGEGVRIKTRRIHKLGNKKQVINKIEKVVQDEIATSTYYLENLKGVKLLRTFNVERFNKFYA